MASLPVMGLLANNHLGERGLFAYVDSTCGFTTNYVPFVTSTWGTKTHGRGKPENVPFPTLAVLGTSAVLHCAVDIPKNSSHKSNCRIAVKVAVCETHGG